MSAKIDFNFWREPAEIKSVGVGNQERSFGEIHFHRHVLQPGIITPSAERHDRSWVASERLAREGIDDEIAKWRLHSMRGYATFCYFGPISVNVAQ